MEKTSTRPRLVNKRRNSVRRADTKVLTRLVPAHPSASHAPSQCHRVSEGIVHHRWHCFTVLLTHSPTDSLPRVIAVRQPDHAQDKTRSFLQRRDGVRCNDEQEVVRSPSEQSPSVVRSPIPVAARSVCGKWLTSTDPKCAACKKGEEVQPVGEQKPAGKAAKSWAADRWPPEAGTASHALTGSGRVARLATLAVRKEVQTGYLKQKTT